MLLTETAQGEQVRITDMTSVSQIVRRRLVDLDIVEGTIVSLKRAMFFKGPIAIEAQGQCIAIRRKDAEAILVERL
ncbi:FeoA family protein [Laceyella putida]|uniref:Ferrous iron transport protein A n=1 Tax=Laceyella putida TaxID=110101 RepID=A0ABW2RIX3_9BACL